MTTWGLAQLVAATFVSICVGGLVNGAANAPPAVNADEILRNLSTGKLNEFQAIELLQQLPQDTSVRTLVNALEHDEFFQQPRWRSFAYRALGELRAEQHLLGRQQLLFGVQEDGSGAEALGRLGDEAPTEVISALGTRLSAVPTADKAPIIRALAFIGVRAKPYLPEIEKTFRDRNAADNLRETAAQAMVDIGSMEWAWPRLTATDLLADVEGEYAVLAAMGYYGAKTHGDFGASAEIRSEIRGRVLAGMKNPDSRVRELALKVLVRAFGREVVIIRSRTDYELNPQIKSAMQAMATQDPDDALRQRASRALVEVDEMLDRMVEIILIKQQTDAANSEPHRRP